MLDAAKSSGVQRVVPDEVEAVPAALVPVGQVDDAAVEAANWRRTVALDAEVLDGVHVREERHLARLRLQHRDAVEQVFVRARAAAVDPRQRRGGRRGQRHPGHRLAGAMKLRPLSSNPTMRRLSTALQAAGVGAGIDASATTTVSVATSSVTSTQRRHWRPAGRAKAGGSRPA
jgi:hypothetical protein